MSKRRGRLPRDELDYYENEIAASNGILRRILRLVPIIRRFVTDPDVREVAERDAQGIARLALSIRERNKRLKEERREEKRNK